MNKGPLLFLVVVGSVTVAFAQEDTIPLDQVETQQELDRAIQQLPPDVMDDPQIRRNLLRESAESPADRGDRLSTLIESRDAALGKESSSGSGPSAIDASQASQDAREVLDSPIYRDDGPGQEDGWLDRAMRNLGERLEELFQQEDSAESQDLTGLGILGGAAIVIAIALVLVVLAGIVWLFVQLIAGLRKDQNEKVDAKGGVLAENEPILPSQEWRKKAGEHAAQGRFREAVRCLYLGSLMMFDEADLAEFVPTETNWEHYRRIEKAIGDESFREPTLRFDHFWYGHTPCDANDFSEFERMFEAIVARLKRSAA